MLKLTVTDRSGQEHELEGERLVNLSLMEVIRDSGVEQILAICGGCCSCSTCHVYIDESDWERLPPMTDDESDLLEFSDSRTKLSRLACQIRMRDEMSGLKVTVAPE